MIHTFQIYTLYLYRFLLISLHYYIFVLFCIARVSVFFIFLYPVILLATTGNWNFGITGIDLSCHLGEIFIIEIIRGHTLSINKNATVLLYYYIFQQGDS